MRFKASIASCVVASVSALIAVSAGASEQDTDFRTWSDSRKEAFLLEAEILSEETLTIGVTNSKRLTLSDGRVTHDAHFQTIEQDPGREGGPRDHWRYNIAAYRLDRILGLNMVPPSVERKIDGRHGALTWWIDDVAMMEVQRIEKKLRPPDPSAWAMQIRRSRVFTQLTYNTDPNTGNLLITHDWKMRLIDFTRAFGRSPQLLKEPQMLFIDEPLYDALRALDFDHLRGALAPYLGGVDLKGLMKRRDKIVAKFAHLYPRE